MSDSQSSFEKLVARVKSLASRFVRDKEGCLWLEGVRHFVQAYDARLDFEAVVHSPVLLRVPFAEMIARRLAATGVPRWRVSPEQFRRLSSTVRASGIGAIVRQHWSSLETAAVRNGPCWIVVEQIRSPGNLGTMLRTAEAAGVTGVIFVGDVSDPFHGTAVRASMGGIFPLPLVRTTPDRLAVWVARRGLMLVGLAPDANRLWTELQTDRGIGLVVGEERAGLSERLRALCETTVRLPMTGRADSLNVAVAASVVMYELVRRSHTPS